MEAYILREKPEYPEIPFDFPALLARRKSGETWREIANSLGKTSGQLSAAWTKYRNRVREALGGGAA